MFHPSPPRYRILPSDPKEIEARIKNTQKTRSRLCQWLLTLPESTSSEVESKLSLLKDFNKAECDIIKREYGIPNIRPDIFETQNYFAIADHITKLNKRLEELEVEEYGNRIALR